MTTRIKITNEGPERAMVVYYNEDRQVERHKDLLMPGQSIELDVWNGKLPLIWPMGHSDTFLEADAKFYSVPPAHY